MNNDFKILVDFLGRLGPDVSGREFDQPPLAEARQLTRFAIGKTDAEERDEMCVMLQLHPAWLHYLAERVKESRIYQAEGDKEPEDD